MANVPTTTQELIRRLRSSDPQERAFAAQELGDSGDPAAVAPLAAALQALDYGDDAAFTVAAPILEALGSFNDASVGAVIVETLRATRGHDLVPDVACNVLVRLRATHVVAALEQLFSDAAFADHADALGGAIAELGGPAEGPFFLAQLGRAIRP